MDNDRDTGNGASAQVSAMVLAMVLAVGGIIGVMWGEIVIRIKLELN